MVRFLGVVAVFVCWLSFVFIGHCWGRRWCGGSSGGGGGGGG